jgi:hypothetical protein
MDVDSIAPGADFVEEVRRALERCDVTLAVIGPRWLTVEDRRGRQRLSLATDHVRVELKVALESGGVVLPVLVGDAVMPEPEELPDELASLSHRNAIDVHDDAGFKGDIERLVRFVHRMPTRGGAAPETVPAPGADAAPPTPANAATPPGIDKHIKSPTYARALSAIAGLLLILAGASFAWAGRTLPGSSGTQIADLAVAAGFVVLGAGLLVTRSRWKNTGWRATAGLCIGLLPFLSLRMLRSAELLSLRMSRSDEPRRAEELFGPWGPLALIFLALGLIGILLARNPEVAFARPRVFGDPTATAIVFGVAALIGLAAIGVALPTPRDNFTSGKFSDPMLLYFAVPLAIIAAVTQGLPRAVVLAGWTAGSAGVLVTTIWFRQHPRNIPGTILDAHLLLSILTVAILATITVLALRKS